MEAKFLIEQTAGVTVLFALAAVVATLMRSYSAASRHMVWSIATVAALLVPVASFMKPAGSPSVIATPMLESISVDVGSGESSPWTTGDLLTLAWAVGFVMTTSRLGVGLWRTYLNRRMSTPYSIAVQSPGTQVRLSDTITVPETSGAVRPVILLPVEAARWSAERLRVVLAHELVHIERRDWLTQLVAQFSACVYWFHPLAWFALAQMRKERELACDDGVLRLGFRNSEYAQHLVDVARTVRAQTESLSPSVAMATRSHLETRVRAILDPALNRGAVGTWMKAGGLAAAALGILFLSSVSGSAADASNVSGTVLDPSTAVVPDAFVVLRPSGEPARRTVAMKSNSVGEFTFTSVEPGEYTLDVQKAGFKAFQQKVTVAANTPLRVNVPLNLGGIRETVSVQGQGQRSAAQPGSGPAQRIRVGGNIQPTKVLTMVRPEYPAHMKAAGIEGAVMLEAVISREGDILNLQSISPDVHPDLVAAAIEAVSKWKYQPTLLNGEPVEVATQININFTLAP